MKRDVFRPASLTTAPPPAGRTVVLRLAFGAGLQHRQATTPLDLLHPKNRSHPVHERCRCRLKTDASIPLGRIQSP